MATTVHDLLAQLRATAANNRDLGTAFERLMVAYLKTDPQWTAQFSVDYIPSTAGSAFNIQVRNAAGPDALGN